MNTCSFIHTVLPLPHQKINRQFIPPFFVGNTFCKYIHHGFEPFFYLFQYEYLFIY